MKVSDTEDIGIIARQRRQELQISQAELAARSGVTRQWLTRFERGNSEVSLSKVFAVLRELDLKVRLDVTENVNEKSIFDSYDIPRVMVPRIEIPPNFKMTDIIPNFKMTDIVPKSVTDNIARSIVTSGIAPMADPSAIAQIKERIKAIDAAEVKRPNEQK